MADEIVVTQTLKYSPASGDPVEKRTNITIDITGTEYRAGVASIATSETTVTIDGTATIGYVWLKNLDSTNYVEVGTVTAQYHIRLKAGDIACFRTDAKLNVYLKANTAACDVEYLLVEE